MGGHPLFGGGESTLDGAEARIEHHPHRFNAGIDCGLHQGRVQVNAGPNSWSSSPRAPSPSPLFSFFFLSSVSFIPSLLSSGEEGGGRGERIGHPSPPQHYPPPEVHDWSASLSLSLLIAPVRPSQCPLGSPFRHGGWSSAPSACWPPPTPSGQQALRLAPTRWPPRSSGHVSMCRLSCWTERPDR